MSRQRQMVRRFHDRAEAGRLLARQLDSYAGQADVMVLGLPRGGIPVAAAVARALHAPLDVMPVRKLGVPGHEELAMGAIAAGGVRVLNDEVIDALAIPRAVIESVAAAEQALLVQRERLYRGERPAPVLAGRTVILVDDGLATGMTMCAAVAAARRQRPARVVIAVPVAAPQTLVRIRPLADDLAYVMAPPELLAVGFWYEDFEPTSDEEVIALLRGAAAEEVEAGQGAT